MSLIAPRIPPELYRDVISTLDVRTSNARNALLSLALSSKQLCHESQRVLFERNDIIAQISRNNQECVMKHHQFVQAIFNHPARFGAFVRAFVQVDIPLASNSHQYKSFHRETKTRERLWELTIKTLPYLINLRVLVVSRNFTTGPTLLQNCDFQLDFLHYQPSKKFDNLLSVVLPTQRRLLHLSLYSSYDQNSAILVDENCVESLISVECDMHLLERFGRTQNIIAIALSGVSPFLMRGLLADETKKRLCQDALVRLKYLRIYSAFATVLVYLKTILEGMALKIEIMELEDCDFNDRGEETIESVPLLELRVLSLQFPRSDWPDRLARISGARKAFSVYPKLHEVLFWDDKSSFKWIYSRPQGLGTAEAGPVSEEKEAEVEDESEGKCQNLDSMYVNAFDGNESHQINTGKGTALFWEKKVPAKRMWGTLWWKSCGF